MNIKFKKIVFKIQWWLKDNGREVILYYFYLIMDIIFNLMKFDSTPQGTHLNAHRE